jgi:hypothetical protein
MRERIEARAVAGDHPGSPPAAARGAGRPRATGSPALGQVGIGEPALALQQGEHAQVGAVEGDGDAAFDALDSLGSRKILRHQRRRRNFASLLRGFCR